MHLFSLPPAGRFLLVGLLLVGFRGPILLAEDLPQGGSAEDYRRSQRLEGTTRGKVFRDRVTPQYLPGESHLWYRVDTGPDSYEFVLVDTAKGTREAAFDHEKLAAALREMKEDHPALALVGADRLPIDRLSFDIESGTVSFRVAGQRFAWDLATYQLSPAADQSSDATGIQNVRVLPLGPPQSSRRTGAETEVTFINRSGVTLELFWLDSQGNRRSYGKLPHEESRSQHTYAGHVWLTADPEGKAKLVVEAEEHPGRVEITEEDSSPTRSRRLERTRRTRPGQSRPGGNENSNARYSASIRDHNVYLRDRETDEEHPLTDDGTEENRYGGRIYWSPDGTRLVVMRTKQGDRREITIVRSTPDDQLQPKVETHRYAKPGDAIDHPVACLFDIEQRKRIPLDELLFPNPWSISDLRWDDDSSRFTFLYNQRGHRVMRWIAVDAQSGESTAIIDEQPETFFDYAHKRYLNYLAESGEVIWMSERDGWNHLYLIDAATGEVKNQITAGEWVVRGVERVDEAKRQIWFKAGGIHPGQDPYYIHHARVNFDGSGLTLLTEGDGTHTVEYSPEETFYLDRYSRVDQPPITELRRTEDGSLVCQLETADHSALLASGWQSPQPFVAKGRDGETDIHGVIYRPRNFDPERKYPVVESIYAGPHSAFVQKEFRAHHRLQSMAELGFILVQIDGMGTSHRSKKFHDVSWKNLGDAGLPDRVLWIQAAAKEEPAMDLSRVGIFGGSAGGQNAAKAVLTQGDFYHVAVADCGCHDNRMDKIWWNELWMSYPVGQHYEEASNMTHAAGLTGKLMLVVGELDTNVDPASTMQLAAALVKADKDFELVVIPGAGHGAAETRYGSRRRADFLVRHLLGVEPRWE